MPGGGAGQRGGGRRQEGAGIQGQQYDVRDIRSNVQAQSIFLNPDDNPRFAGHGDWNLVAHIYFATNETELDDDDLRVLDTLKRYYSEERLQENHVYFSVVGWADWRQADNISLSQGRARSVRRFLDSTIGQYPGITENRIDPGPDYREHETNCINAHYYCTSQGNGVAGSRLHGYTASDLSRFRVAEIYARMGPVLPPLPEDNTPESTRIRLARGTLFSIRLLQGIGADIPLTGLSGNWNAMEVVDVRNHIRQIYEYTGLGFGIGLTPVSCGGISSWHDPEIVTGVEIHVRNFGGPTAHAGGGVQGLQEIIQSAPHGGADVFFLVGPTRYGSDTVLLVFVGEPSDRGLQFGAGFDGGALVVRGPATRVPDDYLTKDPPYPPPWEYTFHED